MDKHKKTKTSHGYLYKWMQKNYRRIWPQRTAAPRFMGKNALRASGLGSFDEFGKALIERLAETIDGGRNTSFEFYILDTSSIGAWVVWPAECYGVFITRGLVRKIQEIGWHGVEAIRRGRHIPVKMNFFREVWGDLPDEDEYYREFGVLIARIAFAFIIHHELAHAGLGHEGVRFLSARKAGAEIASLVDENYWDEFSNAINASNQSLRAQALETDADVHGMLYTRRLINDEAEILQRRRIAYENVSSYVRKTLLRNADCRQFMIFAGVAVGIFALVSNLEVDRIDDTRPNSHPPAPSRLLLMFHVVGSITMYEGRFWELRSAAISCAIILISIYLHEQGLSTEAPGIRARDSNSPINTQVLPRDGNASKWESKRHLSIIDAVFRQDEIGDYWEELVREMRVISNSLRKYALFPAYMRYFWYETKEQRMRREGSP
jgi:hypothetical protein